MPSLGPSTANAQSYVRGLPNGLVLKTYLVLCSLVRVTRAEPTRSSEPHWNRPIRPSKRPAK